MWFESNLRLELELPHRLQQHLHLEGYCESKLMLAKVKLFRLLIWPESLIQSGLTPRL